MTTTTHDDDVRTHTGDPGMTSAPAPAGLPCEPCGVYGTDAPAVTRWTRTDGTVTNVCAGHEAWEVAWAARGCG